MSLDSAREVIAAQSIAGAVAVVAVVAVVFSFSLPQDVPICSPPFRIQLRSYGSSY